VDRGGRGGWGVSYLASSGNKSSMLLPLVLHRNTPEIPTFFQPL
jgi:hypothetical protein